MRKFFLAIFAILLIAFGIYGLDYFSKLKQAKQDLSGAVLSLNERQYDDAVEKLKNIIASYPYSIVKAPALYLLADTYEKQNSYNTALETHRLLITHKQIPVTNDWLILSIIAVSKLYRSDLLPLSEGGEDAVYRYIGTIENTIDRKKEQLSLSPIFNWDERPFISLQNNLVSLKLDNKEILKYLDTELAFLYMKAGKYEEAAVIFSELHTNAARFGMAQIYFDKGNYRQGIDILKELTVYDTTGKINVLYLDKMFEYAELLFKMERYTESIDIYTKIISLSPDSKYAEFSSYKLATYYYASGDYKNAQRYVDTTLSNTITLKDEDSYLLKGYIYYDSREYYRALKVFEDFPKRFPQSQKTRSAKEWKAMCERSIKYLG